MDTDISLHVARRTALKTFLATSVRFSPHEEPYANNDKYETEQPSDDSSGDVSRRNAALSGRLVYTGMQGGRGSNRLGNDLATLSYDLYLNYR